MNKRIVFAAYGKSDIYKLLLARHEKYLNEFQESIYERFTQRKRLLAEREGEKKDEKSVDAQRERY